MKLQESGENYLETILLLRRKQGYVRLTDVANELDFSKPSVSRALSILRDGGFITVEPSGNILFTPLGEDTASAVYERHRLITSFLTRSLGLDEETADTDACRIEHIISPATFEAVKRYVEAAEQSE